MILAIPIPMLWRLQVRLSKKLAIGALLCSGLFVIAAAIIRAVLTLGATPSGLNINRWGVRETIVGIVTVSAPILRPMFNRSFWSKDSYHGSRNAEETHGWTSHTSRSRYGKGTFELRSGVTSARSGKVDAEVEVASNGSQENIIKKSLDEMPFGSGNVMVHTTYQVQSRNRDEESSSVGTQRKDGYQSDVVALNRAL
jgi:hypothetical protein